MQNINTAIVTGATGHLGFALTKHLISQGIFVYCVCRPKSSNLPRLIQYLESLSGETSMYAAIVDLDLHDLAKLPERITNPCDVFYHLGWDGGVKVGTGQDLNILTSAMALIAAAKTGCRRFIVSGSQAEYGLHTERIYENSTLHPVTAYGEAKVASYFLTKTLAEKHGVEHIWCRIFSAYGPNQNRNILVDYVLQSLMSGVSPEVTPCEQLWNFIHEEDVTEALYALGTSPAVNGVYNIGHSESKILKEYLEDLRMVLQNQIGHVPEIKFGAKSYGFNHIMHLEPDISKIIKDTGCQPKITFADGIANTWTQLSKK